MPQMAPISWLMLFIMFTFVFIMFNTMNYFSYITPAPQLSKHLKLSSNYFTWKW